MEQRASEHYPADWRPRFAQAYHLQNKAWVNSIVAGKPSAMAANAWDGYCAARIAEAGVVALESGLAEPVELIEKPELYN